MDRPLGNGGLGMCRRSGLPRSVQHRRRGCCLLTAGSTQFCSWEVLRACAPGWERDGAGVFK